MNFHSNEAKNDKPYKLARITLTSALLNKFIALALSHLKLKNLGRR